MTDLFTEPAWRTAQIDPPWLERGGGKVKRGADRHYPLMSAPDILSALRGSGLWRPEADAHLWCWYTDTFLPDALWLVEQLGFAYKRTFQWIKTRANGSSELRYGIGQYARGAHEGVLFCTRGKGMSEVVCTRRRDIPSVIMAPVPTHAGKRVHSRKPDAAYELIEARSHGPYCEFFARRSRPGWSSWGNEV